MAIDTAEQAAYADVVKLVNRTDKPLEFLWDSELYTVQANGFKMLPRHIALSGINAHRTEANPEDPREIKSLLGIEEGNSRYPVTPLNYTDKELKEIREAPKGVDTELSRGTKVKMGVQALKQPKESFADNA